MPLLLFEIPSRNFYWVLFKSLSKEMPIPLSKTWKLGSYPAFPPVVVITTSFPRSASKKVTSLSPSRSGLKVFQKYFGDILLNSYLLVIILWLQISDISSNFSEICYSSIGSVYIIVLTSKIRLLIVARPNALMIDDPKKSLSSYSDSVKYHLRRMSLMLNF